MTGEIQRPGTHPPTVILCGGRGTRLREYTEGLPKVLVEVGGRPILWHIMKSYGWQGYTRFLLALGYRAEQVRDYFTSTGIADNEGWSVDYSDTGADTNTGGRIHQLRGQLREPFFATYGDGLADLDLGRLLEFHRAHGRLATLTVVRPQLAFGLVDLDADDRVQTFREKPRLDHWINGGFFVFEPGVFEYLEPDSILEAEPMQRLAADGELVAYRHEGFWACMDTYKDNLWLNEAWESGAAPWSRWPPDG